jgi:hypothetical protein
MELLRSEPLFQLFAVRGIEFDEQLSIVHGEEDAKRTNRCGGIEPRRQFLGALPREAG